MARDFMADAGSGHRTADFLLTTGGLKGLLHNGCALPVCANVAFALELAGYMRPGAFAAAFLHVSPGARLLCMAPAQLAGTHPSLRWHAVQCR